MATLKVILDTRFQKKDKTYPIKIRIFSGRKYKDISTGKSIPETDFDTENGRVKKTNPNHKLINQLITQKLM